MKFHVNSECIGCGLCASTCPEIFRLTDKDVAVASDRETEATFEASALDAKDNCPVSAIEVMKGEDGDGVSEKH